MLLTNYIIFNVNKSNNNDDEIVSKTFSRPFWHSVQLAVLNKDILFFIKFSLLQSINKFVFIQFLFFKVKNWYTLITQQFHQTILTCLNMILNMQQQFFYHLDSSSNPWVLFLHISKQSSYCCNPLQNQKFLYVSSNYFFCIKHRYILITQHFYNTVLTCLDVMLKM